MRIIFEFHNLQDLGQNMQWCAKNIGVRSSDASCYVTAEHFEGKNCRRSFEMCCRGEYFYLEKTVNKRWLKIKTQSQYLLKSSDKMLLHFKIILLMVVYIIFRFRSSLKKSLLTKRSNYGSTMAHNHRMISWRRNDVWPSNEANSLEVKRIKWKEHWFSSNRVDAFLSKLLNKL